MSTFSTTKLSSKGQVVIPEEIRGILDLKTGTQFVVWAEKDVIILKTIHPSSFSDFEKILDKAEASAKKSGLKKKDIDLAIKKVRKAK
ncbi:MAG: AbrB/MazE/SpoVT family DNA-binding domain-containing protein [Oligoflexia bacterium]|nr:AbrB/MazE/SpoVT family DNA-binding domain-containing protein [Oligoflexia bacterium]